MKSLEVDRLGEANGKVTRLGLGLGIKCEMFGKPDRSGF